MSKDVKVGIIGGGFGRFLATHCPYPSMVHDVDQSKSDVTFDEMKQWANHIIIATPNSTHFNIASKALMEGKHTLILKPFVLAKSEVTTLYILANHAGVKLRAGFNQRYRREWEGINIATVQKIACTWTAFREKFLRAHDGFHNIKYDLGVHFVDLAMRFLGPAFKPVETRLTNSFASSYYGVFSSRCFLKVEVLAGEAISQDILLMRVTHVKDGQLTESVVGEEGPVNMWKDVYTFQRMMIDFVESNVSDDQQYIEKLVEFMSWS
jgi:predicted dehydrogenase